MMNRHQCYVYLKFLEHIHSLYQNSILGAHQGSLRIFLTTKKNVMHLILCIRLEVS